ncbi:MAG: hypothetical protein JHC37_06235 [Campylobacteraceae bacterium]|jgi:hypothetical protein|nr:hypothetical protein [Campylobacteraceae bacterium]
MAVQRLTSKPRAEIKEERFRFLTPFGIAMILAAILVVFVFIFALELSNNQKIFYDADDASTELYLENIVKTSPQNENSKINLALIYAKRGHINEGLALLKQVKSSKNEQTQHEALKAEYVLFEKKLALTTYNTAESIRLNTLLIEYAKKIYPLNMPQSEKEKLKQRLCFVGKSDEAIELIKKECKDDIQCLKQLADIAKISSSQGRHKDAANIYEELVITTKTKDDKKNYFFKTISEYEAGNMPLEAFEFAMKYQKELNDTQATLKTIELARANSKTEAANAIMTQFMQGSGI